MQTIDWPLTMAAASSALSAGSFFLAVWALRLALVARKRSVTVNQELTVLRQEFEVLARPDVLFAGPAFDQRLSDCLRPVLRAELDRYPVIANNGTGPSRSSLDGSRRPQPTRRDVKVTKPAKPLPTAEQLAEFHKALATLLCSGSAVHDPDGYLEVAIVDVLSQLASEQSVDECSLALKQLNRCFQQSSHDVLRQENFLRVRHLRSVDGNPNLRVGIKLEAVTPFLQETLKG